MKGSSPIVQRFFPDASCLRPLTKPQEKPPKCPDCKQEMQPLYERPESIFRYIRGWKCTNPNCTLIEKTKTGRIKRAAAL